MKLADAVRLHQSLRRWQAMQHPDVPVPVRLGFAIELNLRATTAAFEAYAKIADPMNDATIAAYERDRRALVEVHARRDEAGALVVLPGGDADMTDRKAFDRAITGLRKRHRTIETAVADFNARVRELDTEEVEVVLRLVPLDLLPEKLAPSVLAGLPPMIEAP